MADCSMTRSFQGHTLELYWLILSMHFFVLLSVLFSTDCSVLVIYLQRAVPDIDCCASVLLLRPHQTEEIFFFPPCKGQWRRSKKRTFIFFPSVHLIIFFSLLCFLFFSPYFPLSSSLPLLYCVMDTLAFILCSGQKRPLWNIEKRFFHLKLTRIHDILEQDIL